MAPAHAAFGGRETGRQPKYLMPPCVAREDGPPCVTREDGLGQGGARRGRRGREGGREGRRPETDLLHELIAQNGHHHIHHHHLLPLDVSTRERESERVGEWERERARERARKRARGEVFSVTRMPASMRQLGMLCTCACALRID